jgi:hypothetical protein
MDQQQTLQAAAKAWHDLNIAEGHIARLNGYTNLTPSMRQDRSRHSQAAAAARATLNRLLTDRGNEARAAA